MIENFFNSLIPTIQHFGIFGYWLIFLIFFVDAIVFIGLFIPGTLLAIFFGALTAKGIFRLGDLMFFISIGLFFGDILSFYLGKKGTDYFKNENQILNYSHIEKGEAFFEKHGSKSILIAKFIGFVRPLAPFIAGLSKMKTRRFLFLNIVGIIIWTVVNVSIGYFFGQAFSLIKIWTSRAEFFIAILITFLGFFYFLKWLIFKKGKNFWNIFGLLIKNIWEAFLESRFSKNFHARYPKISEWLDNRTDSKKFSGLPLTILSLSGIYLLIQLFHLIYLLFNSQSLIYTDNSFESLMHSLRSAVFIKIFMVITYLGQAEIIIALAAGFSLFLFFYRKRKYIFPLWLGLSGSILSGMLLKTLIHRPRPLESFYLENSFSFPSMHAILSVSFFGFLAYFFIRNQKSWNKKINHVFGCLFIVIMISFSRIYLGVHYLSDVWAGITLGSLFLIIGIGFLEWRIYGEEIIDPPPFSSALKIIIGLIIIGELIFFSSFVYHSKSKINFNHFKETLPGITTNNILRSFDELELSRYCESLDGQQQEPLNLIISATDDEEIKKTFKKLNWLEPDHPGIDSIAKNLKAAALNKNYPEAPIAPSFWQTEVNDFSFEKPTAKNSVRQRHHLKIWRTNFKTPNGKKIYVGVVGLDLGVNWWAIHKIDPNIDSEREYLFNEMKNKKILAGWSKQDFVKPALGKKKLSGPFFTDGKIYIMDLR